MIEVSKPRRLRPGDTVAVVSPSWGGPGAIPRRYQMGRGELERRFGFRVVEMPHALRDPEWVRAHPRERADDLNGAFADPTIDGIIASIGGDDSLRILPHLDLEVIRQHPKVLIGYSDTTTLHLTAFTAGLQTFYGPSVMAGIAENAGMLPYTERWFRRVLMTAEPVGAIEPAEAWTEERLEWSDPMLEQRPRAMRPSAGWAWVQGEGRVEGHLLGGCIDVLEWIKGTRWWPPLAAWHGALFYWETSEEAPKPWAVERWLRNYIAQGVTAVIAGMLVGRPRFYTDEEHATLVGMLRRLAVEEMDRPAMPIVAEMDFRHTDPMLILPNGGRVVIDFDRREVVLPESAVV